MECRLINKKQVPCGAVKRDRSGLGARSLAAADQPPGRGSEGSRLASVPSGRPARPATRRLCAPDHWASKPGCPQRPGVCLSSPRYAGPIPSPESVSLPSRNRSEGCLEAWNFPGSVDSTAKGGLCVPESRRRWFVKVDLRTGACPSLPAGMTDGRFPAGPQPGRGRKQHPSGAASALEAAAGIRKRKEPVVGPARVGELWSRCPRGGLNHTEVVFT